MMRAVEFEAEALDSFVKLPDSVSEMGKKHLKLIVLFPESEEQEPSYKPHTIDKCFKALGLKTRGFKFDRDEAHAR